MTVCLTAPRALRRPQKTVKKPQPMYVTEYATKHQYQTVYATHTQHEYHTVTKCPSTSYGPPSY